MAAKLCTVTHGFPLLDGLIERTSRRTGQAKEKRPPCGDVFQSTDSVFPESKAVLKPVGEMLSKAFENFCIARTPQALATVVSHRPLCCRPSEPRTNLGRSSLQVPESSRERTRRTAFVSLETISHQRKSVFSVENPNVVPWRLSRALRSCSASLY